MGNTQAKPTAFDLNLRPSEQRAEIIQQLSRDSRIGSYFALYKGSYQELPVIEVPAELLFYRPDNGRLITRLQELQCKKGLGTEYFRENQEQPQVQQELHSLLLQLAKDPQGPIYQELQAQAQQTEPLLISAQGLVINGNRRLAAMRELLAQDPVKYQGFSRVRAAVLPAEAGLQDFEYVEAALQLAPETKLAYSWINRRLKLRRQRDELKLPMEQILESYRLQSAQEVERELQELELAEQYLRDFCHKPGEYALLEDAEEFFLGLNQTLQDQTLKYHELWRLAGFAMIFARHKLKVGLKRTANQAPDQWILAGYFPFAEPSPGYAPRQAMFELALDEGLLRDEKKADLTSLPVRIEEDLADILRQSSEASRLAQTLVNILDQIRIDSQERNAPKRFLKNMQQARRLAERLEEGALSSKQKAELKSELAAVELHSSRLLGNSDEAPGVLTHRRRKLRKLKNNPHAYFRDAKNPLLRSFKVFFSPRV